jgi:peptidoglycan hydrolase-like protein with peptidoglycan-binding domain
VVPSEPWHLRYVCGDTPPPAVVAYAAGQPAPAASTAAAPVADVSKDANKELQQALKDKGFYNGAIDGDLGPKTQEAVKAFKVANKLNADSVVGPKVKELLGLN